MHRHLLLLGLLAQQEMHGYKLHEFMSRRLSHCSDMKKSTAYSLLDRLAQQGYVSATTDRAGNYPERKVYAVTTAGRAHFLALLRDNLVSFDLAHDYHVEVGMSFIHELVPEERGHLLMKRRERLAQVLTTLQRVVHHGGSVDLVIGRSAALLRAEVEWLDANIGRAMEVTSQAETAAAAGCPVPVERTDA